MKEEIRKEDLKSFSKSFREEPKNLLALNAVTANGIAAVAISRKEIDKKNFVFSDLIDSPDATNQERSGRCWLFSGLSVLALYAMKNLNVETFELSEIYQMFWDKLEKANYFLENIIETRDVPLSDRTVNWLISDPISDGGQWNMFVNLIKKYGVLPKTAMPETVDSNNSNAMDSLLTSKVREYAKYLRDMHADGSTIQELREKKGEFLKEFYKMLCIHMGTPPETFHLEWRDKDHVYKRGGNLTPQEFYKEYVKINLDDMVSLINSPTKDKPFKKLYTVKYLGNMVGGMRIHYLNVDLKTFKKAAIDMIKGKHPVWFGCDVEKMLQTEMGAMDLNIYDYDIVYDTEFKLDKAARLDYGDSSMTHAMVITGVDLDEHENPKKWRVENSWGGKIGDKGYMYMMDKWFDDYLYEIVVRKEYLSPELLEVLKTDPMELPPWDPMGKLAI
jgi:bleomycin hydrolase